MTYRIKTIEWEWRKLLIIKEKDVLHQSWNSPISVWNRWWVKSIYHSNNSVCIWVFENREDRNNFVNETVGMKKQDRENHFEKFYKKC